MYMRALLRTIIRAIATLCRCPPDILLLIEVSNSDAQKAARELHQPSILA